MDKHFAPHELQLLDSTEEIEIETVHSDSQELHRAVIWVVVVGPHAYVRSVNGEQGHWYRHLIANSVGAIYAEDRHMPIRAVPITDVQIQLQVSEAYQRKYGLYPQDVAWIVGPTVQSTTLRLEPSPASPPL